MAKNLGRVMDAEGKKGKKSPDRKKVESRKGRHGTKWSQIYDNIYGFIRLTETEERIINSPYYQRLRWIRQLGFANYIFPGAEHTRFAHAIGALHCADEMIRALGLHVDDQRLFGGAPRDEATRFHQSCRIAALLHDVGTFPFSHSIEESYIRHGLDLQKRGTLPGKQLPNSHEHLGSFIIKNTQKEGGITRILNESGLDGAEISKLIKGDSQSFVGNQILHSDLDADRLDYLVRDAHHTGIHYGQIDRDYILYHMTLFTTPKGQRAIAIRDNATLAVEDYLIARFNWYSQVVKNSGAAKFDILAGHLARYLLRAGLLIRFDQLLDRAENDPDRFFGFNDIYFFNTLQSLYWDRHTKKSVDPVTLDQIKTLVYRVQPSTVRLPEFEHRTLEVNTLGHVQGKDEAIRGVQEKITELQHLIDRHGSGHEWIVADIPSRDVVFTKSTKDLDHRDSVKILQKDERVVPLVQKPHSLMSRLSKIVNFMPNVYANAAAMELFKRHRIL